MNILFVTHYPNLYGANRSLLALIDGIKKSQINPLVILPKEGEFSEELKKREIPYKIFPFQSWMSNSRLKAPLKLLINMIALPVLLWKLSEWKLDLIYSNSSVTPIGAWLAFIKKKPHIWHIREFGWEDYRLKYDLGRRQFEFWLNKAAHIICVSKAIEDKVLSGVTAESTVVYNGVISESRIGSLDCGSSTKKRSKTIFGIIGVLQKTKGQEQAIKAFKIVNEKNPNTELRIAGSGDQEYEIYLHELTSKLKIQEKVSFLGYIEKPFEFYSNVDVVLVCSQNEGMGRVTAEAMIAGKVIIGLDNAGTSEIIDDGQTGLLYDGETSSLVKKMKLAIKKDLSLLTEKAKGNAKENFVIENYALEVKSIIEAVHT